MTPIQVFLVDDHAIVRQGVRSVLSTQADIHVAGEADSASNLFAQLHAVSPDVILLDIRMPGQNGIEITQRLKREHTSAKILMLSTYEDEEFLFGALRAGADGYLLKSASPEVLADAIRQVHRGERLLSPTLVTKLMHEFQELSKEKTRAESGLTEQELQVLQMVAAGETNKTIGEHLYWSEVTVKRKVQDILEKLGVANRAQAVAEGARRGLL